MDYQYGHFNAAGDEFIVTDPATPRAFDNFIWNESVFANIWQTGVGCFDYQIGDKEAVQLYTGNSITTPQTGKNGHVYGRRSGGTP